MCVCVCMHVLALSLTVRVHDPKSGRHMEVRSTGAEAIRNIVMYWHFRAWSPAIHRWIPRRNHYRARQQGRMLLVFETDNYYYKCACVCVPFFSAPLSCQVYNKFGGFCLETQHFPDSVNQATFPTVVLRPDAEFNSTTIFKFSVPRAKRKSDAWFPLKYCAAFVGV